MTIQFKCQHCNTIFHQPFAGPCPECDGIPQTVIGKIEHLTESEMIQNLKERERMTSLEFMAKYESLKSAGMLSLSEDQLKLMLELGSIGISQLTDEQIISFRKAINAMIEIERIAIQAMDHEMRTRGLEVKMQLKEEDLKYIAPSKTQLDEMEKRLSKKGESAEKIKQIRAVVDELDFSDI